MFLPTVIALVALSSRFEMPVGCAFAISAVFDSLRTGHEKGVEDGSMSVLDDKFKSVACFPDEGKSRYFVRLARRDILNRDGELTFEVASDFSKIERVRGLPCEVVGAQACQ